MLPDVGAVRCSGALCHGLHAANAPGTDGCGAFFLPMLTTVQEALHSALCHARCLCAELSSLLLAMGLHAYGLKSSCDMFLITVTPNDRADVSCCYE